MCFGERSAKEIFGSAERLVRLPLNIFKGWTQNYIIIKQRSLCLHRRARETVSGTSEYRKAFICNKEKKFNMVLHVFIKEWAFTKSSWVQSVFPFCVIKNLVIRTQNLIYFSDNLLVLFLVKFSNLWAVAQIIRISFYYLDTQNLFRLLPFHEQLAFLPWCHTNPAKALLVLYVENWSPKYWLW